MIHPALSDARHPDLERYLTHWVVLCWDDQRLRIGEAGDVQQIADSIWMAKVGYWGNNPVTGDVDPRIFVRVSVEIICGPDLVLVTKDDF